MDSLRFESNAVFEGRGGSLAIANGARVFLTRSLFNENDAQIGGAISVFDDGTLTAQLTTFAHNRALEKALEKKKNRVLV